MANKKIVKRTQNGEVLYFGTHTDAVQVEENGLKKSLTQKLAALVASGGYNSTSKKIELKNSANTGI